MKLNRYTLPSPMGEMTFATQDNSVVAMMFSDLWADWEQMFAKRVGPLDFIDNANAPSWLSQPFTDYFAGNLAAVHQVPVTLYGTDFQQKVWAGLAKIPPGETWSYGQLAKHVGSPKGSRAVGAACGKNPVSLIIPCHRAVGGNGALTGFAGGIERKRWLLQHESAAHQSQLDY